MKGATSVDICLQISKGDFSLDVAFTAPGSGITALLGPSGCGKTTLLRAIAGLEPEAQGHCVVAGNIWQQGDQRVATYLRPLGYVFQEASLLPHLDVLGNLEYGFKRATPAKQRIGFSEAVSLLGVEPLLNRRPDSLSGGERQRVAIARALLTSPELLLMDEPLAALDANSKREILPYLERLHTELGIPVIYVSHSTDEVARLADHLLLMEQGKVVASGAIGELLARTDLPLARGDGAEVLIEAQVSSCDDKYQLLQLSFAGGQLQVAGQALPLNKAIRLRILARDVSLALQPPQQSSILNCIQAQVVEVSPLNSSQMLVRLDAGGTAILSHITRKSADTLAIKAGMAVYAQIKSVALLY